MLKFSKINISNQKNIVKDNSEYLGIISFFLIIQRTCVEITKLLPYMMHKFQRFDLYGFTFIGFEESLVIVAGEKKISIQ